MVVIRDLIREIIFMLREASLNQQAEWLSERLLKMDVDKEEALKSIKDIKSIISGMGSLSDIHLDIKKESINEERYNFAYQELIRNLDNEMHNYLKLKETKGENSNS